MSTLAGKNVGNECRVDGGWVNHMYRLSMLIAGLAGQMFIRGKFHRLIWQMSQVLQD